MKHLHFILFLIVVASCKTKTQRQLKVSLNFIKPSLDKIDSIERSNHGVRIHTTYKISVSKDYFPNADKFTFGDPLLFMRDTSALRTKVTYFFSEPDSSVRLVEYSWSSVGRNTDEIERLFNLTDSIISRQLKKNGVESLNKQDTWSQLTKTWETDSVYIVQFMLVEDKPSRTRVLVSWK